MLTRLIEIFDPCFCKAPIINYIIGLTAMLIYTVSTWKKNRKFKILVNTFIGNLKENLRPLTSKNKLNRIIPLVIFFYILIINISGLLPYIFSPTAQADLNIPLALMTVMITFIALVKNFKNTLIHLVPSSAPIILVPALVIIELVRIIIRPLTLRLRITANIIAGHLILSLVSGMLVNLIIEASNLATVVYAAMTALFILEIVISVIQSFVFSILFALYLQETIE